MARPPNVFVFDTPEQLAVAAVERFVEYARLSADRLEHFSVVLAGGNTPRRVYELLATDPFRQSVQWSRIDLFFGDERCVPPTHHDSNYRMAFEALISKVPIPPANVHRIAGENNPSDSAQLYETELRTFFSASDWPQFDLVLLGMGEDGHTASLFPGSDVLREKSRWVVATKSNNYEHDRVTLTVPVFNHAARVVFLVSGAGKAQRLAQVLQPQSELEPLPAQLIHPNAGSLEWLIDSAAASYL
jgi:6-phosphogluconolactonase